MCWAMDALGRFFDGSYIRRRFFRGVWAVIASSAGLEFVCFINVMAAGLILGSDVLSSSGIILPLMLLQTAALRVFADGLVVLMPRTYGGGSREAGDRLFGSAIVAEALVAALVGALTYGLHDVLMRVMSVGVSPSAYAEAFYVWSFPVMLAGTMRLILERLAILEGRMRLVYAGTALFIGLDIIGLVTLVRPFGVSGFCAAETLSSLASACLVAVGFVRRKPSFRIRLALNAADVRGLAAAGLPKVFGRVGDALIVVLLNAFVLSNFGMDWLAYIHFVKRARKFLTAFPDAFDNASMPIVCALVGERNWRGVLNTMRLTCTVTPLAGLVVTLVTVFCAERLAFLCGFAGEDVALAAYSLRWGTVMIASYFLKDILCSYYVARGRILLPSVIRFLSRGLLTFSIGACCVHWLDGDGVLFMRMIAVSDFCILAFLIAGGMFGHGDAASPVLNIPLDELRRQRIFDVVIASESIGPLREGVGAWLARHGSPDKTVTRAKLLVEETLVALLPRTKGKRHLFECVVFAPDGTSGGRLLFCDTLSLNDHANPDAMPISPADVFARMFLSCFSDLRDYNPVIGINRTTYTLPPGSVAAADLGPGPHITA